MRIYILRASVDVKCLIEETENYERREAINPYIIMSQKTLNKLVQSDESDVRMDKHGGYEIGDYKILINQDLPFGEVDIR